MNDRQEINVSLVIPIRDEEGSLPELMDSIRRQTRQPEEVIFVDGGSRDRTVERAREWSKKEQRFRILEAGEATPGRGRNVGIAAASHSWIALTDAGIRLEAMWLERLLEVVKQNSSIRVVYGNYEPVVDSFFKRCAALTYVPPKQVRAGELMRGPFTASMLVYYDVWRAVGGFPDLRAAEDLIFMERIERLGVPIAWAPSATVHWQIQPTLYRTFKRFKNYSKHNVWAGRQRYWHYGVARNYLAAVPFVLLAILHSPWWLVVPLAAGFLRVAKTIWQKRESHDWAWLLNPFQFIYVGIILAVIDVATFSGWIEAIWKRRASRHSLNSSRANDCSDFEQHQA